MYAYPYIYIYKCVACPVLNIYTVVIVVMIMVIMMMIIVIQNLVLVDHLFYSLNTKQK